MIFWRVLVLLSLLSRFLTFTHESNLLSGIKKLWNSSHENIYSELYSSHSVRWTLQTIALTTAQAVTWLVMKIHSKHNLMLVMWNNQTDITGHFEEVQFIAPTELTLLRDHQLIKSRVFCIVQRLELLNVISGMPVCEDTNQAGHVTVWLHEQWLVRLTSPSGKMVNW